MADFTATYVSANSFSVSGDMRSTFLPDRALNINCNGTWIVVHVDVSLYDTETTVYTLESTLTSPCGDGWFGIHPGALPIHDHSDSSQGGSGVVGLPPDHQWSSTELRFKNPDGSWGDYTDLIGPSGIGLGLNPQGDWSSGHGTYNADDLTVRWNSLLRCIVAHSSSDSTKAPFTGASWDTYWEVEQYGYFNRSAWNSGSVTYWQNNVVTNDGGSFAALQEHVSSAGSEPGTVGGASYWIALATKGDKGDPGTAGVGVPTGGTTAQVLAKNSNTNYDTHWVTPTGGTGGGASTTTWCPPAIYCDPTDATALNWDYGRYYKMGVRDWGRFWTEDAEYWDASGGTVYVSDAYSVGVQSGFLGGVIADSWYTVWMVALDEILILPMIRVQAIDGSGYIIPGDHATGLVVENGFLTADDQWVDMWWSIAAAELPGSSGSSDQILTGKLVNNSPDTLDIASGIAVVGDWVRIRPNGDCCYLGSIKTDGSGNIARFTKNGWKTEWHHHRPSVSITGSTTLGIVDINTGISPLAHHAILEPYIDGGANNGAVTAEFADADGDAVLWAPTAGADANHSVLDAKNEILLDQAAKVNTRFFRTTSATPYTADGTLYLAGWIE